MHFPPKFLQKRFPYFFHGAFAPSFIWSRRPWEQEVEKQQEEEKNKKYKKKNNYKNNNYNNL